jgi:hypothetical protein
MSYEGVEEYLCENGHHTVRDVYDRIDDGYCPICRGLIVTVHNVDETNGAEVEDYLQLEMLTPRCCKQCGCTEFAEATYRLKEGIKR